MKIIEVDEELYQYIAAQTQSIGESASDILRRFVEFTPLTQQARLISLNQTYQLKTQKVRCILSLF